MNMQISARSYTNASELMANSKAIRARLFPVRPNVPKVATPAPKQAKEDQPIISEFVNGRVTVYQIPQWMISPTRFEEHVIQFKTRHVGRPTVKSYITSRACDFGLSYADIVGQSRKKHISLARMIITWEIKTQVIPEISNVELGRRMGCRDHTTILHAVGKIQAMKDNGEL